MQPLSCKKCRNQVNGRLLPRCNEPSDIHIKSCIFLQTASYSRVPPSIGGMRLVDVCKTMTGSAFQYQRLRLNFVPSHFGFSHCDSLQSVVVDDIVGMKVVGNLLRLTFLSVLMCKIVYKMCTKINNSLI